MEKLDARGAVFTEKAYAKVNLTLEVLGARADGYHDLRMLLQTVSLADDIEIHYTYDGRTRVESNLTYLPSDRRNHAVAAARTFFAHTGLTDPGMIIRLEKRIPVCAGLGGGSSDAAAVFRLLNRNYGYPLSWTDLETISAEVGSDVPFCIRGGTQLVEGRGEKLTKLSPLQDGLFVLCKPPYAVSTASVFQLISGSHLARRPDHTGAVRAIAEGNLSELAKRLYNVMEDFVPVGRHDMALVRGELMDGGALGVAMSGSGPTVIGLFDRKDLALSAQRTLSKSFQDTFLAVPVSGIEL